MAKKFPMVSVIIPVFNEEEYLPYCLDSMIEQNYPGECLEIIVVDNGSTDSSVKIAKDRSISVISSGADYVGGVRNAGVRVCKGETLVFIDSDCVANKNWIADGVAFLQESAKSAVGGRYLLRELPSFFEKYWVLDNRVSTNLNEFLVGGCIFVKKLDFDAINGFSEDITSSEDTLLSKELSNKQDGFLVSSALSVVHLGYPQNIKSFSERQIWHSSSYTQNLKQSIFEPIFLMIMLHVFSIIAVLFLFHLLELKVALIGAGLFFLLPAVLSLKRIKGANCWGFAFKHIFQIYWVDLVYLCARDYGVVMSLFKKVFGVKLGKSRK